MNGRTAAALRRLRDADPARDRSFATPAPADVLDGGRDLPAIEALAVTGRRSQPRRLAAVAAAIAVVAAVVGVVLAVRGGSEHRSATRPVRPPRPTPQACPTQFPPFSLPTGTAATPATCGDPNFIRALASVQRTLADAPLLPGATRVDHQPLSVLDRPVLGVAENANLIDRPSYWAAPGTLDGTVRYLVGHVPRGMTKAVGGTRTDHGVQIDSVVFAGPDEPWMTNASLEYTFTPYRGGIALRIDSTAIWIPTKPAEEYIRHADSVDVTVVVEGGGSAPSVTAHRTVVGAAAQRLVDLVDGLPVLTAAARHCGFDLHPDVDTLVFHSGGRTIRVEDSTDSCIGVIVTVDGQPQPRLAGSVDAQARAAVGLR